MDNPHKESIFVTIDGCNGIGKTTITDMLSVFLNENSILCKITSEPTKSRIGQLIREQEETLDRIAFASLVAADRYWHLANEIIPILKTGVSVISARYVESSLVLQRLDGLSMDFVWGLNSKIKIPDLSIVLDAEVLTIEERLKNRGKLSFYELKYRIEAEREYYLDAATYLKERGFNIHIVNNDSGTIENTVKTIGDYIIKLLK